MQFVSVYGAHGHAGASALCLGHQGAESHPRWPGRRQADHRGRRQASGGKELAEELHRSEPGGIAPHGLPPAGPASSSLANPPAAPARPAGVQPHVKLPETLATPAPSSPFIAVDLTHNQTHTKKPVSSPSATSPSQGWLLPTVILASSLSYHATKTHIHTHLHVSHTDLTHPADTPATRTTTVM